MFGTQVFRVTDTIWCVRRRSYLTCSYIVITTRGPICIDAGMDSRGRDVFEALRRIGAPPERLRAVLLTHWHNDHAAGAGALREQTGCRVYFHAADAACFNGAAARQGARRWLGDRLPEWGVLVLFKGLLGEALPRSVTADRLVRDGDVIEEDFEVIEAPGHTPGHVAYYYRPAQALFAGDALAVVGGRVRFMARPVTPDVPRARESIARCLSRPIEVLCPGHRRPLVENARDLCRQMADHVRRGGKWPLLG